MTVSVYLAGPVAHPEDGGHGWRHGLKAEFGGEAEWIDPLDKYDVPAGDVVIGKDVTAAEIVEGDKAMVDRADVVLARYDHVPSVGTPMEIMYAYDRDTPVVVWADTDGEISPWIDYHAETVTHDLTAAVKVATEYAEGDKDTTAEAAAASVADEAAETLYDRASHGGAVENHEHIADLWSALLQHDVSAAQVALCMTLVKMSRSETGKPIKDHFVDIAGYAGIAHACNEAENGVVADD